MRAPRPAGPMEPATSTFPSITNNPAGDLRMVASVFRRPTEPGAQREDLGLGHIGSEEPPFPRDSLEDVRPTILERDPRPGHQVLDGIGHEDLAGLGRHHDAMASEDRDAAHGLAVVLDLSSVYADFFGQLEFLMYRIADCTSAADGRGRSVKDGEELVPDQIQFFPAVAGKLVADERVELRSKLEPATVAQCDEPFSHAGHVGEQH